MAEPFVLSKEDLEILGQVGGGDDGIDLLELLEGGAQPPEEAGTLAGQKAPGSGESPGIKGLTGEQLTMVATELCDLCDRYDESNAGKDDEEQEIRDAYEMVSSGQHGGTGAGDSQMVSELMMTQVDQLSARLQTNLMSVKPFIKVDPVAGSPFADTTVADFARSTQSFLNDYSLYTMDMRHLLPRAIHRLVKVGTAVFRFEWEEEDQVRFSYPPNSKTPKRETKRVGRITANLIDNRLVKIWPPDLSNWQRGYTFVGHDSWHSRSSWKRLAKDWKLSETDIAAVEADPGEHDEGANDEATRQKLEPNQIEDNRLLKPLVRITDLYCRMCLPDDDKETCFQVILHRPSRRILWIGENSHFSQRHPYFPVRYKWGDSSAWGSGVGHEALYCWSADTALWNLSLDNLAAGAFNVVLRDASSVHSTLNRPVRPGQQIVTENTEKDFIVRKLGGDAQELPAARAENKMRGDGATGVTDVLRGMGDTQMKSGAGTGSTLALIQQASVKTRMVDANIREDLSDAYGFILELAAQYGTDGLFYDHASPEDAAVLQRLRYFPPRGDVSRMFRIRATAPSASTSDEARKNSYLVIWGFAQQAIQVMDAIVLPILQQENPAAVPRWNHQKAAYLLEINKRVVELNEIPGLLELVPEMPEPMPQDAVVNDLQIQLGQAQQMLAELQAYVQQLTGGGQPQPEQGGGAPMGMEQMGMGGEGGGMPMMGGGEGGGMGQMMGGGMPPEGAM